MDGGASTDNMSKDDSHSNSSTAGTTTEVQRQSFTTVKFAVEKNEILRCNRRGIVSLSSGSEKPSLSVEELIENRRRGMSYASIGRKLGIDPSKDEVLNVYRAIKQASADTPEIEKEDVTVLKHYPTPLWFLWKSEADIIAKECTPSLDGLLYIYGNWFTYSQSIG